MGCLNLFKQPIFLSIFDITKDKSDKSMCNNYLNENGLCFQLIYAN